MLRGQIEISGPIEAQALAQRFSLGESDVLVGLLALEAEGLVLRGEFEPHVEGEQFCARRLLSRIHAYTRDRLRKEIEPVSAQDFMRFLLRWQHVTPATKGEGQASVAGVVEQLQGFEVAPPLPSHPV